MITLTYLSDLARVRIHGTGYDVTGTTLVRVERSINGTLWETIRGGTAVPISGTGEFQLDDYEFESHTTNTYRVIRLDPLPGLHLTGAAGDYASTPDDPALDIVGDLDVRAFVAADDWDAANSQVFACKRDSVSGEESWQFYVNQNGRINFAWWDASQALTNSLGELIQTETGVGDGEQIELGTRLDVDTGTTEHTVTFDYGPARTQLGSVDTLSGTTSVFNSAAALEVGSRDGGTTNLFAGVIRFIELRNGLGGALVANPDFGAQPDGTTVFTDTAGREWTVHGSAQILAEVVESDSIAPELDDIVLTSIKHPNLNQRIKVVDWSPPSEPARNGLQAIVGRSAETGVSDRRLGERFTLTVMTETLVEARNLQLALKAGGTMLVHLPANCPVPGGYVLIGTTKRERTLPSAKSPRRLFELPCTVVTAPPPEIVGSSITWRGVWSLYGNSWTAVWASNPSWRALWAQIGSPDDVVVL